MLVWLLSITLVLIALFAIPVRVSLVAQATAQPRYQAHVCWLFGLVRGPLSTKSAQSTQPKRRSRRRTGKQAWSFKQTMIFVRAAGGAARVRQALGALIASLRPRIELMQINLGLDDPADTGRAFALLAPLTVWLALRYGQIELTPSFTQPSFTVDGRAHFTIVPLQTLGILVVYALSFRTLHAFYIAQRSS